MAIVKIQTSQTTVFHEFTPPMALSDVLETAGLQQKHPCGGRGNCGKCVVEISGGFSDPSGKNLSCQIVLLSDAQVKLPEVAAMSQIQLDSSSRIRLGQAMPGQIGAAVDIGTTTIALRCYDLQTGKLLAESAMENPQVSIAADVIGRIGAAMDGKLEILQKQLLNAIETLLEQVGKAVDTLVITGNTTMLYLLTGTDPTCLSKLPFEADTLFDTEISLLGKRAYLPPCMNAFVGADITCAVLSADLCRHRTALLCDIGTNGEVALWKDGVLYVTSTAAGPAFEGAGISCGCSSIPGAIDKVWREADQLRVHTIGELPAVGLCGSGLIDAVAEFLKSEDLDETGAMDGESLQITHNVALSRKDVRSVQLAKAAIAAGIQTILETSHTTCRDIEAFYIAGGFGSHMDLANAVRIGLFPEELLQKAQVIGNGALAGAAQALLDDAQLQRLRTIAASSRHMNLGGNPRFNANYMEQMLFPFEE